MPVRTNVVIITYNALEYTKATIDSLFAKTYSYFHLTIVDNGSDKDTLEYLDSLKPAQYCKKITVIKNNENAGVGYAYNQGQQVSFVEGVEFTAFCNNDLYFSTDWLAKLESRLDKNPNIAMLSPLRPSAKVYYDSRTSTRDRLAELPETDNWRIELAAYAERPVEEFDDFAHQVVKANRNGDVEIISFPDSLSTCVCLTRNSAFRALNHFADHHFSGYGGEDIDMSWTIMSLGYDCAVDHDVYVHHFRGKSLKANDLKRQDLLKRSNKILYKKWEGSIQNFIEDNIRQGVDIAAEIELGSNSQYWLLYELNQYEKFLEDVRV